MVVLITQYHIQFSQELLISSSSQSLDTEDTIHVQDSEIHSSQSQDIATGYTVFGVGMGICMVMLAIVTAGWIWTCYRKGRSKNTLQNSR